MQRLSLCVFTLAAAAACFGATPSESVVAAAADLARQPEELRPRLRYLTAYAVLEKKRADFGKAQAFWVNSLSREAVIAQPAQVGADLYRVNVDDYGWDGDKLWDDLAKADPYFHVKVRKNGRTRTVLSPYLPTKEITYLALETQSNSPILRADWFLAETSQQEGRRGTGYYDFHGLKSRKDFERLVGLDAKASRRVKREIKAIVGQSTVAINNRQVVRFQSVTGGYWTTLDVTKSTGRANAVRNLDTDFRDEFQEHYGFLPNGLFAFYLSTAQGGQANTAPDNVASDGTSITPDRRVHAANSCVRCHKEGLRPIDDLARRTYTPPVALQSPSYKRFKRLQQLYIADLKKWLVRDQGEYAATLSEVNGLTPAANAAVFSTARGDYADKPLSGEDVARELGVKLADLQAKLKVVATATGDVDPVVAQLLHDPPLPVRREHFEEAHALLQNIMQGVKP